MCIAKKCCLNCKETTKSCVMHCRSEVAIEICKDADIDIEKTCDYCPLKEVKSE